MTKIQWTNKSWNPCIGCKKIASGCKNCYALREANKLSGHPHPNIGPVYREVVTKVNGKPEWKGVKCMPDRLDQPLRWRKPSMIFVCSMGDLFHEDVPATFIARVLAITQIAIGHTYQILTKRPERMRELLSNDYDNFQHEIEHAFCELTGDSRMIEFPLSNIWLGTSVSTQKDADANIPWLLKTPAAVRFVSYEPALEHIDFDLMSPLKFYPGHGIDRRADHINQIICGAESGPGKRPFNEDWARSARDQCDRAGRAFFYKQNSTTKMPMLDGKVWDQMPEVSNGN